MANKNQDNARWPAWIGTLLFAGLTVGLLHLLGLHYWVPPPPEYGIEVNLGYAEAGMGAEPILAETASGPLPDLLPEPEPVAEEEVVLTSTDEEAPAIAAQPKPKPKPQTPPEREPESKPQPTPVSETPQVKPEPDPEKPVEPAINPMALYPGKRKQQTNAAPATGQGIKPGEGDTGSPAGTAQSSDYGRGGAGGISFSLAGRTLMSLVKPEYNSEEQGIVVVKIWVNRQGEVIRTQVGVQGTTTMDEQLWATARRAAMGSRFVPKENAPEEQVGTISYKFIIGQ